MTARSDPEMFIRLLAEALEAERLTRRARLSQQSRASAERFTKLFKADLADAMQSIEPMDCVQQIASGDRPRRRDGRIRHYS